MPGFRRPRGRFTKGDKYQLHHRHKHDHRPCLAKIRQNTISRGFIGHAGYCSKMLYVILAGVPTNTLPRGTSISPRVTHKGKKMLRAWYTWGTKSTHYYY